MNKPLAITLAVALTRYLDDLTPPGCMILSSGESEALEKAFIKEEFDRIEKYIDLKFRHFNESKGINH